MSNLHEIIKKIQKDLYCPVCGKNYEIGEIRLRGLFNHTLIIQTICDSGHVTLFMTTYQKQEERAETITTDDVLDLVNVLEKFDGDFESIWKA